MSQALLSSSSLRAALRRAAPTALRSRGLAAKRAAKGKVLDLGWDKLREPLDAAPMRLPALASLQVVHGAKGPGLTGARKFNKLMPALRWQNPEAAISQRWCPENGKGATVLLQLSGGQQSEFDVKDKRSEDILGEVLKAAGAPEDDVARSVEWAQQYLLPKPRATPANGSAGEDAIFPPDGGEEEEGYADEDADGEEPGRQS